MSPGAGRSDPTGVPASMARADLLHGFVGAVFTAGVIMTALMTWVTAAGSDPLPIAVFCVAAAAVELARVSVTDDSRVSLSLSAAVVLAAVVAVGPAGATLAAVSAALSRVLLHPSPPPVKTLFNVGLYALGAGAAAAAYRLAGGQLADPGHAPSLVDAGACLAALAANFLVNWPLLFAVIRLSTAKTAREVWTELRWMPTQIGLSALVGFTLGAAYLMFGWVGAAIYVAPLIGMREGMRQYTRSTRLQIEELQRAHAAADAANQALTAANSKLDQTNEGLLKTLAAVIDARDIYLYGHSVQASRYAAKVAWAMGLDEHTVRVTELGALLHDLGKIGVPEAILNKPARLTDEEYEAVKRHCAIGYHLLSSLPGFEEVAEIVYSHHEHHDGTGYPRGLTGDEIHLGARIVSAVEATEAMVSDRPYRKGMTADEVLDELARCAGHQWDARVVAAFSEILTADRKHLVMRNSALEVALSRTSIAELVGEADVPPSLEAAAATFATAAEPLFVIDDSFRIVSLNEAAERATGWREVEIQGSAWTDVFMAHDAARAHEPGYFAGSHTATIRRPGGQTLEMDFRGSRLDTNSSQYWLLVAQDAGRAHPAIVGIDPLTGLPHLERLELRARELMAAGSTRVATLVLDIEGMTAINETFGRFTGDAALAVMGRVLQTQLRRGDVAARIGGDTFGVLLVDAGVADAERMLRRLQETLPGAAHELDCVIELGYGAAEWDGTETITELLARAIAWLDTRKREREGLVLPLPVGVSG